MMVQRPRDLKIGGKQFGLPRYIPSVSSVKTSVSPVDYILVLSALRSEQFLLSAFDVHYAGAEAQAIIKDKITEALSNGVTVLMDSGNYESFWKDKSKSWLQENYHAMLSKISCTFAFGFDEQSPPDDFSAHVRLICERHKQDQAVNDQTPIIPIVHDKAEALPSLCSKIADITGVEMIAVPERCLGKGVFARSHCISEIRKAMNATGRYIGLHLLGTGNPISIAIYTLAGADSYDGLEWCRTVVDHETATLFHFAHADFFQKQTEYGDMDIDFQPRTLAHNLVFYRTWMDRLSKSIHEERGVEFCKINFPDRIFSVCVDALRWK
jgi:hypothetical protein